MSWQFDSPAAKQSSDERRCRCDAVIPKTEAKYDTSERGYVCVACKAKKRREFLIKLFGTLGTGLVGAAYIVYRFLRRANLEER